MCTHRQTHLMHSADMVWPLLCIANRQTFGAHIFLFLVKIESKWVIVNMRLFEFTFESHYFNSFRKLRIMKSTIKSKDKIKQSHRVLARKFKCRGPCTIAHATSVAFDGWAPPKRFFSHLFPAQKCNATPASDSLSFTFDDNTCSQLDSTRSVTNKIITQLELTSPGNRCALYALTSRPRPKMNWKMWPMNETRAPKEEKKNNNDILLKLS